MNVRRALLLTCVFIGTTSVFAAEAKTPIRGLVSMGAYKFVIDASDPVNTLEPLNAKAGIFRGIVILASWRELQPVAGSAIPEHNAIDRALDDVRAYNKRNPQRPLAVKLRVWGGFMAPDWAKEINGGAIHVIHKKPRTLGRFWTVPYRKAWSRFQKMLAERYDGEPLIHEVAMTSCMTFTAEPFFLPGEATVAKPLVEAGFKEFQYKQCLNDSIHDYEPWKTTNVEVPLNPIHMPLGNPKGDAAFTEAYMRACRGAFRERCVFDNHDLDTEPAKAVIPIYAAMKRMGSPIEFQEAKISPTDFEGTIRYAVEIGASSVELWQDFQGFTFQPDEKLKAWARLLERQ